MKTLGFCPGKPSSYVTMCMLLAFVGCGQPGAANQFRDSATVEMHRPTAKAAVPGALRSCSTLMHRPVVPKTRHPHHRRRQSPMVQVRHLSPWHSRKLRAHPQVPPYLERSSTTPRSISSSTVLTRSPRSSLPSFKTLEVTSPNKISPAHPDRFVPFTGRSVSRLNSSIPLSAPWSRSVSSSEITAHRRMSREQFYDIEARIKNKKVEEQTHSQDPPGTFRQARGRAQDRNRAEPSSG